MAGKSSSLRQPRRGQEVVPDLKALLVHALVLVVALRHAPLDAPAAQQRLTTVPVPALAVALLPAAPHPQAPNQRSLLNAPPRPASRPPRPLLHLLKEPPCPVHALVHVPALALLLLTASAKSCVYVLMGINSRNNLFHQ